jgi:hypothetical protein
MARNINNPLLRGVRGRFHDIILKQYPYGTVISSVPDRSKVKLSKKQKQANTKFKEAVIYAQSILKDPAKRKAYEKKLKRGRSVYHTALAEYLRKAKTKDPLSKKQQTG